MMVNTNNNENNCRTVQKSLLPRGLCRDVFCFALSNNSSSFGSSYDEFGYQQDFSWCCYSLESIRLSGRLLQHCINCSLRTIMAKKVELRRAANFLQSRLPRLLEDKFVSKNNALADSKKIEEDIKSLSGTLGHDFVMFQHHPLLKGAIVSLEEQNIDQFVPASLREDENCVTIIKSTLGLAAIFRNIEEVSSVDDIKYCSINDRIGNILSSIEPKLFPPRAHRGAANWCNSCYWGYTVTGSVGNWNPVDGTVSNLRGPRLICRICFEGNAPRVAHWTTKNNRSIIYYVEFHVKNEHGVQHLESLDPDELVSNAGMLTRLFTEDEVDSAHSATKFSPLGAIQVQDDEYELQAGEKLTAEPMAVVATHASFGGEEEDDPLISSAHCSNTSAQSSKRAPKRKREDPFESEEEEEDGQEDPTEPF